jgi:hypothetical protein
VSPFQRFATAGFAAGVGLTAALGQPLWLVGLLAAGGLLAALTVVLLTRLCTGREMLVYQHHEVAVLAASAAILTLTGQPIGRGLDAVALGLGLMLAVGRLGCHAAGCCHGRPAKHGVRYSRDHLDGTFTSQLVGVPLFPVPLCEAGLTLAIVAVGTVMVREHAQPGETLAWFMAASASERFMLECLRGDTRRRRWLGVTEAQWIALALTAGVAVDGAGPAYTVTGLALVVATVRLTLGRQRRVDDRDISALAACLAGTDGGATLVTLPCGALLSAGQTGGVWHLTLSGADGSPVGRRRVRQLALYAARLIAAPSTTAARVGGGATTHVLLTPVVSSRAPAAMPSPAITSNTRGS